MDASTLVQDHAPTAEQKQAYGQLRGSATREELAWCRRFEEHTPEEVYIGEEERMLRLEEAVKVARYEVRGCWTAVAA